MQPIKICQVCGKDLIKQQLNYCSRKCQGTAFSFIKQYHPRNEETKEKIRQTLKSKGPRSLEICAKIRAGLVGRKASIEERLHVSLALKGKKRPPLSEEAKMKMGLAKLGKKHTLAHCLAISKGNMGKKHSEETKQKIRAKVFERLARGDYRSFPMSPSKTETSWGRDIKNLFGIELESSFWLQGRCYDYKFNNILFEIDGSYWHSSSIHKQRDALKETIAVSNGYTLYRFSADTPKEALLSIESNKKLLEDIFQVKMKVILPEERYQLTKVNYEEQLA
jgi:hypothetical protein